MPDSPRQFRGIQLGEPPVSGSRLLSIAMLLSAAGVCLAVVGIVVVRVGATIAQDAVEGRPGLSDDGFEGTAITRAERQLRSENSADAGKDAAAKVYPVTIRQPSGPPRMTTSVKDLNGNAVTVACSTCHATRSPNASTRIAGDLDEFHGGMAFSHGTVSCLSCHHERDYDALKLADGSRVEFSDVMTLCGQCHGPQQTAFQHGAHGGMTGYWDRTRGPQMKNNCVDCHNPHTPQFPSMQPVFKPRDRFLDQPGTDH